MADTLPNIVLPPQTWVDITTLTGIGAGEVIAVQNLKNKDVYLCISPTQPLNLSAYSVLNPNEEVLTQYGDSTLWAWSQDARDTGLIQAGIVL